MQAHTGNTHLRTAPYSLHTEKPTDWKQLPEAHSSAAKELQTSYKCFVHPNDIATSESFHLQLFAAKYCYSRAHCRHQRGVYHWTEALQTMLYAQNANWLGRANWGRHFIAFNTSWRERTGLCRAVHCKAIAFALFGASFEYDGLCLAAVLHCLSPSIKLLSSLCPPVTSHGCVWCYIWRL